MAEVAGRAAAAHLSCSRNLKTRTIVIGKDRELVGQACIP